jgi:hypothetical protein
MRLSWLLASCARTSKMNGPPVRLVKAASVFVDHSDQPSL